MRARSARLLTALAAALFLACAGSFSSWKSGGAGPANTPTSVTAVQLAQDYRTLGPGEADKKYKDKILEVTGMVHAVANDAGNTISVVLSDERGMPIDVKCWFEGDDKALFAQIKPGRSATIQGKCEGRTSGVMLRKCKLKQ